MTHRSLPDSPSRAALNIPGPPRPKFIGQVVGHVAALRRDPIGFLTTAQQQFGNVVATEFLFGAKAVFLLGPAANELVLIDSEQLFSNRAGYAAQRRFMGDTVLFTDFEEHSALRQAMKPAFKPDALRSYLTTMNLAIAHAIGNTIPSKTGTIEFYGFIKQLTLNIATQVFAGINLGPDAESINRHLIRALDANMAKIPLPFPGGAYRRGLTSLAALRNYLGTRLPERRNPETAAAANLFTQLAQATDDAGQPMADNDVIDNVIGFFFAGHDTTSSALSTLMYALATHSDWQEAVRAECQQLIRRTGEDQLNYDHLRDLPITDAVLKEALRLYAPLQFVTRRSVRAFDFDGHTIPENVTIFVSPQFTHHQAELFPEPAQFRPQRFQAGQPSPPGFAWLPFGRGAHTCLGMHFATMQIKAFLYRWLPSFRVHLPLGYEPQFEPLPITRPKNGLRLLVEPIA